MVKWYGVEFKKGDKLILEDINGVVEYVTLEGVSTETFDKIEVTINGFPVKAKETALLLTDSRGYPCWTPFSHIMTLEKDVY